LSLFLLLDEDSQAKILVNLLKVAGNKVQTVNEVGITGFSDDQVLEYARQHSQVLLTRNCGDFLALHEIDPMHPGILAIYQDAELAKNMSYQAIVKAIDNLRSVGLDPTNQFIVLNQWNYRSVAI
jgi:Domain of unknown function (DUF5615)